jgi:hypothetical protein
VCRGHNGDDRRRYSRRHQASGQVSCRCTAGGALHYTAPASWHEPKGLTGGPFEPPAAQLRCIQEIRGAAD